MVPIVLLSASDSTIEEELLIYFRGRKSKFALKAFVRRAKLLRNGEFFSQLIAKKSSMKRPTEVQIHTDPFTSSNMSSLRYASALSQYILGSSWIRRASEQDFLASETSPPFSWQWQRRSWPWKRMLASSASFWNMKNEYELQLIFGGWPTPSFGLPSLGRTHSWMETQSMRCSNYRTISFTADGTTFSTEYRFYKREEIKWVPNTYSMQSS